MSRISIICILVIAINGLASSAVADMATPPTGVTPYEITEPAEASGVAWDPSTGDFLVVGDDDQNNGAKLKNGGTWESFSIGGQIQAPEAIDIAVNSQSQSIKLVVGEDDHTLSTTDGQYTVLLPNSFRNICNRGAEGLTIRWNDIAQAWDIIVLWEGGYFESGCELPDKKSKWDYGVPKIIRYFWKPGVAEQPTRQPVHISPLYGETFVQELNLDGFPVKRGQRFRAADIAWHPNGETIAVLLSSTGPGGKEDYEHTWLLLYTLEGEPVPNKKLILEGPDNWGEWEDPNWEGLDYSPDGSMMVMVSDGDPAKKPQWLVVFPAPF